MGLLQFILKRFSCDMGIDLGTANTLVHVGGCGILLREPSVIAIETENNKILAVGEEAKRMIGRTPDTISAIRPVKDGSVADFDQAERMLRHFIHRTRRRRPSAPRVVVGIPCGITEVEERAVKEAAKRAGAKEAYLIEEPMAAAIGAGLPVEDARGSMIVDVGGGTTEVAIIALGGIVASRSIRIAGDRMDEAIINHVRRRHSLLIGQRTAEDLKIAIGSACPQPEEKSARIGGRDLINGRPRAMEFPASEVREAIQDCVKAIVESVKLTLEACPPELSGDIMETGITLTGGGALLKGLDDLIATETSMPVRVAKDPLSCVVMGAGRVLDELHENPRLRKMLKNASLRAA